VAACCVLYKHKYLYGRTLRSGTLDLESTPQSHSTASLPTEVSPIHAFKTIWTLKSCHDRAVIDILTTNSRRATPSSLLIQSPTALPTDAPFSNRDTRFIDFPSPKPGGFYALSALQFNFAQPLHRRHHETNTSSLRRSIPPLQAHNQGCRPWILQG
jgi:hypothetical protein